MHKKFKAEKRLEQSQSDKQSKVNMTEKLADLFRALLPGCLPFIVIHHQQSHSKITSSNLVVLYQNSRYILDSFTSVNQY